MSDSTVKRYADHDIYAAYRKARTGIRGQMVPDTEWFVLASDYDALQKEVKDRSFDSQTWMQSYLAAIAERDALQSQLSACQSALEKREGDAERYRYLRDRAGNDVMRELEAESRPSKWDEIVDEYRGVQLGDGSALPSPPEEAKPVPLADFDLRSYDTQGEDYGYAVPQK